ncbi:glutaredoxin family protein [Candidatus Saccharibacteria bacterium]|jgi:glutaredoxin|nr:glutaredoxin family protein [Candidatus Saccharibacteria bacterium]
MKITVYGTMTCAYCFALKDWLSERGVKFEYHFIDVDYKKAKEMFEVSGGQTAVPFSTIEHDGELEKIVGFDRAKFNKILKEHGK